MPFDFGIDLGSFDFGIDSFLPSDLGSLVDGFGTEFLDTSQFTEFNVSFDSISDLGGYEQVGSFAGDSGWYDAFGTQGILEAAESVDVDAFFESTREAAANAYDLTVGATEFDVIRELPLGDQIKAIAGQVSQDFTGFIKDAQGALQVYQKFAPVINAASSALGIQNPLNQVVQPLSQAVGIAGAASGVVGAASTGNVRTIATNPAVVSTVYALSGGGTTQLGQTIGTGVSIYNTAERIGSTLPPVNQPGSVVATNGIVGGTFRELTDAETLALERRNLDPSLINSFVPVSDAGTSAVYNYNTAVATRDSLTPVVADLQLQVEGSRQAITQEEENIVFYQNQLDDPDLTDDQRAEIEANIQNSYNNIALAQEAIDNTEPLIISTSEQIVNAEQIIANTNLTTTQTPAAVGGQVVDQYAMVKNTNGTYSIFDRATGNTVQSNLSEQQAILAQQDLNFATPGITINTNTPVDVVRSLTTSITGVVPNTGDGPGATAQSLTTQLRNQQAIRSLRSAATTSQDWRVRLKLAPGANYLYKLPPGQAGILAPLSDTDGVIFPYTPSIETAYKANYSPYDLTHSNFRGYFYQGSYVDAVNVRATFTAQDTQEANYLLAVIHFFRSVTKMFYGQDAQRGAPPPLVYLSGLGDYQFAEHPCVVSQFNYTLPPDVDYIRAGNAIDDGTNFLANRVRTTIGSNPLSFAINRLLNNNLTQGAQDQRPNAYGNNPPVDIPTYVPTRIEMGITLLPIQSRQQVSTQFSVQGFGNGNLLKGGFW